MELLSNYTFQIVAAGTMLLAALSAAVGAFSVYKGQSLIGDAIGHATFPGVVLAFMVFSSRNPGLLMLGAIFSGALCYLCIQAAHSDRRLGLDAHLAIFLSGFFGIGMALKSFIQGNKDYAGASQAGLEHYIFGQSAYLMEGDLIFIFGISTFCLLLLLLFYKEFKLYIFDEEYARVVGLPCKMLSALLLVMTISVIGIGIKAVGSILISSFLIIPCVAASQWSEHFSRVLFISSGIGAFSAFVGTYFSTAVSGLSTGPSIILISCAAAFFSMLFAPRGLFSRLRRKEEKKC